MFTIPFRRSFLLPGRKRQALLDKQSQQQRQPAFLYVLAQIGLALLFFAATLILHSGFKESLAELLLVLTDAQDEELLILNAYTRESLNLFLALFSTYLLCCVFITMHACKRR